VPDYLYRPRLLTGTLYLDKADTATRQENNPVRCTIPAQSHPLDAVATASPNSLYQFLLDLLFRHQLRSFAYSGHDLPFK
jgi:hypothetical protein